MCVHSVTVYTCSLTTHNKQIFPVFTLAVACVQALSHGTPGGGGGGGCHL